jgi:hypothetical protein
MMHAINLLGAAAARGPFSGVMALSPQYSLLLRTCIESPTQLLGHHSLADVIPALCFHFAAHAEQRLLLGCVLHGGIIRPPQPQAEDLQQLPLAITGIHTIKMHNRRHRRDLPLREPKHLPPVGGCWVQVLRGVEVREEHLRAVIQADFVLVAVAEAVGDGALVVHHGFAPLHVPPELRKVPCPPDDPPGVDVPAILWSSATRLFLGGGVSVT